ncbi:MAG: hypothetical protein ACNYPI_10535 [Arenicellales bacterium WSBS_2016_MAG_OTU3]
MTHQGERDNLVFVSVRTGIGAGLVVDGNWFMGRRVVLARLVFYHLGLIHSGRSVSRRT